MSTKDDRPFRVRCEGSLQPCNLPGLIGGLCQMCGGWLPRYGDGSIVEHDRDDVLAMIERGDFG